MNFNFNETAGISQNSAKNKLEGNKIHEVTFDGCEKVDFKDGQFKVLRITFSNNEGEFVHTIFQPDESRDMQDTQGAFGPQPANYKSMMLLLKHLIDAVNPELGKAIDSGKKSINTTSWDSLRDLMVKATETGKGTKTKIKLFKNKKGEAVFPGFLAAYSRTGQLYMTTNCIGNNIFFTAKELKRIQTAETAKPTTITNDFSAGDDFAAPAVEDASNDDFGLDLTQI